MTQRLVVHPGGPLTGSATLVGDKSISHRALLIGALADGSTRVANLSPCGDVRRTLAAVRALGVTVERPDQATVIVHGRGVRGLGGPEVTLDCGDSGTTMRLLAGLLAGQARRFTLNGAPGLRRRPMARVVEPLRAMGAELSTADDGRPPIRGQGGPLQAADHALRRASAQVGSAILLAALNAEGTTTVRYPLPVRDHTERLLADSGAPVGWDGSLSRLTGPVARLDPPGDGRLRVPDDVSAAAFLLAAAAIVPDSSVRLPGVGINPGRTGLLDVLEAMGAALTIDDWATSGSEPTATLRLAHTPLGGFEVAGPDVPRAIDELPLVAVLGTQATGRTVVRDAAELRVKECDRIAAIVAGLQAMGADIEARPDGFAVNGPTALHGAAVDGHDDHRIVMALTVAGLVADGPTTVTGAERTADSFPGFVDALRALGAEVGVIGD